MPRRNYNPKAGRRRPTGTQGAAFIELQQHLERRAPAARLSPADVDRFQHKPGCRASSVTTFNGTRGDLMARCHSCGALQPVTTAQETQ